MSIDADITTENGRVRFNIGDVSTPFQVEDGIIDAFLSLYPTDTAILRIWKSTIDVLRFQKANIVNSGTASRRREREGGVEVEVYGTEQYKNICDLLDWFENNPPQDSGFGVAGLVFGGTSETQKAIVEDDGDSVGAGIKRNWYNDRDFVVGDDESTSTDFFPDEFVEQ